MTCRGCSAVFTIRATSAGLALSKVHHVAPAAPDHPPTPEACAACGQRAVAGDTFCSSCGANLAEAEAVAARKTENRTASVQRRNRRGSALRHARIDSAASILVWLAVLFLIGAGFQGRQASTAASDAHRQLAHYGPDDVLEVDGVSFTVAELRRTIDLEVMVAYGVPLLLAAIMLGLFYWARRSALPAVLTGLCIYIVVLVLNGIFAPETLLKGLILKGIVLAGLGRGMSAALTERALRNVGTRAPATGLRARRTSRSA